MADVIFETTNDIPGHHAGSVLVTGTSSGANVAVAYNSSTKIGLISWRGSVGTRDWLDVSFVLLFLCCFLMWLLVAAGLCWHQGLAGC